MSILSLGNENGDVGLFNFTTRTITRENYANNVVKCLKFSTDGAKLFAAIGNMVYEVETEDLHKVTRVYKAPSVITDFSVHWEGGHKLLYTCSDRLIQLWDARNIQPYRTFTHGFKLNCIDILSQEHVLVTGDSRGSVQSWNVRTMSPTYEYDYRHISSGFKSIAVCPGGSWICARNNRGYVFNFSYGNKEYILKHLNTDTKVIVVPKCIFPRNSLTRSSIVTFDHKVAQYDPETQKFVWEMNVIQPLQNHLSPHVDLRISSTAVNHDASIIFTGLNHGIVHHYTPSQRRLAPLDLYFGTIHLFHGLLLAF